MLGNGKCESDKTPDHEVINSQTSMVLPRGSALWPFDTQSLVSKSNQHDCAAILVHVQSARSCPKH